jgi:hypothetical protein
MARFDAAFSFVTQAQYVTPRLVADIRTGPTDWLLLHRVELTSYVNGPSDTISLGIGMNSSVGALRGASGIIPVPEDGLADPGGVLIGLAWSTLPGAPSNYMRRAINIAASSTAGALILFESEKGIVIPPSSSYGIWELATNENVVSPGPGFECSLVLDI